MTRRRFRRRCAAGRQVQAVNRDLIEEVPTESEKIHLWFEDPIEDQERITGPGLTSRCRWQLIDVQLI